jgi:hypothetical protein
MKCTRSLSWALGYIVSAGFLVVTLSRPAVAQSNPCAPKATKGSQNPCAAKNPCSVKNPCAANPCAPGGKGDSAAAKAITVKGEVVKIDPGTKKLVLKRESGQLDLTVGPHSVVRDGAKVKALADIKPGEMVTVSYVDSGKERTAWYVYLASATSAANPCGGNPCAANPCAAKQPCAPKATKGR